MYARFWLGSVHVSASNNSKHMWSHFKVHRQRHSDGFYKHIVWGPLSLILSQPQVEQVQIHADCGGLVSNIGEDSISYCEDCEHICEGDTAYISLLEFESRS